MLKPAPGSLLVLASALILSACAKEEPAAPATQAPAAAPPAEMAAQPHPTPATEATAVDLAGIEKAEGGKTVAEIYAEKDQLDGQAVTFRGKVVKVNPDIMGRNWLHVRDGSGAEGTNDLTVTTTGLLPAVGDTVVVIGKVALNRDFGMGYNYPVIIEEAEIAVEAAEAAEAEGS